MADDDTIANGVGFVNDELGQRQNEDKLRVKIEALEQEKLSLINENEEIKAQVLQFHTEIESLKSEDSVLKSKLREMEREIEESMESKKALDAITREAHRLESEVSRLQEDLSLAMIAGAEASSEIADMKNLLAEKEVSLEELKGEKLEEAAKVKDLERRISANELSEWMKKMKMEDDVKRIMDEKQREINDYKKKLQLSVEKLREMEGKVVEMQSKVVEAEVSIDGLKERSIEAINGLEEQSIVKETKGFKVDKPVIAVGLSAAFLATAAVVSVHYARRA